MILKKLENYNHIILSFKNVVIKDYNKKLVFINKDCNYLMTDMINNTTNVSLSNNLRDTIDNLKEEGFDFSHIAEI